MTLTLTFWEKIVSFTPKLHVLLLLLQTHIDQQHQFGTNNRVDHIQIHLDLTLQSSVSRLHQVNVAKCRHLIGGLAICANKHSKVESIKVAIAAFFIGKVLNVASTR